MYHVITKVSALLFCLILAGCAAHMRAAVPTTLTEKVEVLHFQNIRFWGDAEVPNIKEMAKIRTKQILASRPGLFKGKHVELLAISGGGQNGAFGAGFLNGWTATGNRPDFEVVTGVSTGALIAPFAFLGPAYDTHLKEIYTRYSTKDILQSELVAALLGGNPGLASSKPMYSLISQYINNGFLAKIAHEHERGRRLLIGTTNLDAGRPVVWDMGKIATQGTPEALILFRTIMLASASLPGVFPPVYIKVKANQKLYEEMHVDGGVTNNTFLLPHRFDVRKVEPNHQYGKSKLYVLINDKLTAPPKVVEATIFSIADRSLSTLIRQQTEGDLLKLYLAAKKNRIAFNMAEIPYHFEAEYEEAFDKDYMNKLYQLGYETAIKGYQWRTTPPGY